MSGVRSRWKLVVILVLLWALPAGGAHALASPGRGASMGHCMNPFHRIWGLCDDSGECRACVRVSRKKTSTAWNYESREVPVCIPRVHCSLLHHCSAATCGDAAAAQPATKRVLIKHKVVEETIEQGFESRPLMP